MDLGPPSSISGYNTPRVPIHLSFSMTMKVFRPLVLTLATHWSGVNADSLAYVDQNVSGLVESAERRISVTSSSDAGLGISYMENDMAIPLFNMGVRTSENVRKSTLEF